MNKWTRNEKIAVIGVFIAISAIAVSLTIPELRKIAGLVSHNKPTVEEIKPVPKSQITRPPSRPQKQLSPSAPKETAKQTTKPEEPAKVQEPKPIAFKGSIEISCYVVPPYISPNETAMITVSARISNRSSVLDQVSYADIFITCPGGTFPSTGTNTLVGKTDQVGYFRTLWNPPRDLKGKFSLGVEVKKEGFRTSFGTCTGEIR